MDKIKGNLAGQSTNSIPSMPHAHSATTRAAQAIYNELIAREGGLVVPSDTEPFKLFLAGFTAAIDWIEQGKVTPGRDHES